MGKPGSPLTDKMAGWKSRGGGGGAPGYTPKLGVNKTKGGARAGSPKQQHTLQLSPSQEESPQASPTAAEPLLIAANPLLPAKEDAVTAAEEEKEMVPEVPAVPKAGDRALPELPELKAVPEGFTATLQVTVTEAKKLASVPLTPTPPHCKAHC